MLRALKKKMKKNESNREGGSEMSDIEMISSLTPSSSSKSSGSSSSSTKARNTKSSKSAGDLRSRPPILRHPDAIFEQWLEERSNTPWIGDIGGKEYYKKNEEANVVKQNEVVHNDEIQYKEQIEQKKSELVTAVRNVLELYNNLRIKLQLSYNQTLEENLKNKYSIYLADINETELFLNKTFIAQNINDKNINDLIEKAKNIGIYTGDIFEHRLNFIEIKHKCCVPWNKVEKSELLMNSICERGTYLADVKEECDSSFEVNKEDLHLDLTTSSYENDDVEHEEAETSFIESGPNITSQQIRLQYHLTPEHCDHVEETELFDDNMSLESQEPDKIDVLVVRSKLAEEKPIRIKINRNYNYYQTFEHEHFVAEEVEGNFFSRLFNNIVRTIS